jgi:hypothetical protein
MLKVSQYKEMPLKWWFEQHLSGRIEMAPPYQRRSNIWSKWKQAHLIDSLLNDFDVPKFYMADFTAMSNARFNKSHAAFAIIDGKQRLGAIFSFFEDELPLNKSCVIDDFPNLVVGGLKYSELKLTHSEIARKVELFIPTVMSVLTDDKGKIEELFVRLNTGEPATGAERRNAMPGPVPELIREIAMHRFFTTKIRFGTKRMQEFNLIAKLLLLEYRGEFADTKKNDLDKFSQQADHDWKRSDRADQENFLNDSAYARARDRVVAVLERLTPEFDDADPLLSSAGSIPVLFWIARNHPRHINELHDFAVKINEDVNAALQEQKVAPQRADPQLIAYYTMSRTTNDQASLMGRYRVFESRFLEYVKPLRRR